MPLIVDAHEDLAWNVLTFGRDYTRPAHLTRQLEQATATPAHNGQTVLGLDDYRRGRVAVVFGSLYATPVRRHTAWETQVYADSREAHRLYSAQLDTYRRLADEHEAFCLIGSQKDLQDVLATWAEPEASERPAGDEAAPEAGADGRRIGLVPLMEGADAIVEPDEAEACMERGLRIVGLAWGATRYAGGTGEPGPLTPEGRSLLSAMAEAGLMLDLAHASDASYLEALERFEGVVLVSHANPRALLKDYARPERMLSDEMIARLAERGGVVGIMPQNRFLKAGWRPGDPREAVTLDRVAAMIDHVCQVTGSFENAGLGTDFDGGAGVEGVPAEIDTIADVQKLGPVLRNRGYTEAAITAILGGNWLRLLQRGLPE
jgi:membrane dipeptidase